MMEVRQSDSGKWEVVNTYNNTIISGFNSNSEAWAWVDRNTFQGRADTDRHNRIRDAFSGENA